MILRYYNNIMKQGYKAKKEEIEEIIRLYVKEHLSCGKIAKRIGKISRQQVWNILRSYGVNTTKKDNAKVEVRCEYCGRIFKRKRFIYLKSHKHFCSLSCYHKYLKLSSYFEWRHGQRIARKIIQSHFPEIDNLYSNWVAHHIDGDCTNNHISNLMAFKCQADHIKWHRSKNKPKPVWPK